LFKRGRPVGNVEGRDGDDGAFSAQPFRRGLQLGRAPTVEDQGCAGRGQSFGDGQSNALARARSSAARQVRSKSDEVKRSSWLDA